MKRETQIKQIKSHFLKGFSISAMEAFKRFGITNLSGRIYDLKQDGLPITSVWGGSGQEQFKNYYLDTTLL